MPVRQGNNPGVTLRFNGLPYYFYPHTTTSKTEIQSLASRLRKKGYKVRTRHVYSRWNKRMQYEVFTRPKHGDATLIEKFK